MLTADREGVRYPDLLIAFNANPAANRARLGYLIPEQGKPPDFVLEVASQTTGERDETTKRADCARMGVPEYWRFDESGGRYHNAPLAGDSLVDGMYAPIPIHRTDDNYLWGRSAVLNLDICWKTAPAFPGSGDRPLSAHIRPGKRCTPRRRGPRPPTGSGTASPAKPVTAAKRGDATLPFHRIWASIPAPQLPTVLCVLEWIV